MGGTGRFDQVLLIFVVVEFFFVVGIVGLLVLVALLPFVAGLAGLAFVFYWFWVMSSALAEVHDFSFALEGIGRLRDVLGDRELRQFAGAQLAGRCIRGTEQCMMSRLSARISPFCRAK